MELSTISSCVFGGRAHFCGCVPPADEETGRQKDAGQSNSSSQRTAKYKEQYQDNHGNIAVDYGIYHIHGIHFHKREIGRCSCRQLADIVLIEKSQRHPFQNVSQSYSLVSGCFITDTFLRDGRRYENKYRPNTAKIMAPSMIQMSRPSNGLTPLKSSRTALSPSAASIIGIAVKML